MSTIRAIRTEADYRAALARIDALMDAEFRTLTAMSWMCSPTSWSSMRLGMCRSGIRVPWKPFAFVWSRVGSRRGIWFHSLAAGLGFRNSILASASLRCRWRVRCTRISAFPQTCFSSSQVVSSPAPWRASSGSASRSPWSAGWIEKRPNLLRSCRRHHARSDAPCWRRACVTSGPSTGRMIPAPGQRENGSYALKAWCWEVFARANTLSLPMVYKPGTVDLAFLLKVAQQSWSAEGPRLAHEFWRSMVCISCVSSICRARTSTARRCNLRTVRR